MTAISSLESIHKKGLFGNHHKKKESDLIQISEVKNLTIIQVVNYKKSKIQLEDIFIDNLKLPLKNLEVSSNKETRILWNSQNTWLIVSFKEDIIDKIKKNFNEKDFAVTDISHSRAVIKIKGFNSREIIKKGCPLNLNIMKKNNCAGTVFSGINILIDFEEDNPETFNLFVLRSFGESFYHHITDAALEYGFLGS